MSKEEKTEQQETTTEQKQETQQQEEPVSQEVLDANKAFDEQIDETGDEKDAADEDTSKEEADKEKTDTGEKTEQKADEKSSEAKADTKEDEKFSPDLLERAAKAGLTLAQATSFGSPQNLENALSIFKPKESGSEKKSGDDKGTEVAEYDCGLNPDNYDEGVIAAINKVGKENLALKALLEKATADIAGSTKATTQQAERAHTDWLDRQIERLGDEYKDIFGKGTIDDLEEDTPEYKNRAAIDTEMLVLLAGYRQTGQKVPSRTKLFSMALNNKFGDKTKQAAVTETKEKLEKRAKQTLGRGSESSSAATGMEKALKANKDFDAELDKEA